MRVCKVLHELDSRMPELELKKLELPDFCKDAEETSALDSLAAARSQREAKTG